MFNIIKQRKPYSVKASINICLIFLYKFYNFQFKRIAHRLFVSLNTVDNSTLKLECVILQIKLTSNLICNIIDVNEHL